MENNTKIDNLNCECLRPDVEIQGDCTPPVIDVDTPDTGINYDDLSNKPVINDVILKGDVSGDDLGLVDKTTEPNRVYATDDEGKPTTIPYSEEADAEYIVRRDENGDVIVPLRPQKDDAAASKKYVDDVLIPMVYRGVVDNQTLLPTEGNENGDLYLIREFVEPVPEGMTIGKPGRAIYNTESGWGYREDEINGPDGKSIIFDSHGDLAVQLSSEEGNSLEIKDDGLYAKLDSELEQKINTEIARATAAENNLNTKIETEISRAATAEQQLQSDILAEAERATTAEEELQSNIDTEAQDRTTGDNELQENINSEAESRANADEALQENIDAETERVNELSETVGGFDERIQSAQDNAAEALETASSFDERIQSAQDNAAEALETVGGFDDRINQEVEDREEGDRGLQSQIGNLEELDIGEYDNLVAAMNDLNSNIGDVDAARSDGDEDLQNQIGNLSELADPANNLVDAINSLSTALTDEAMARTDADNDLSDRIGTEEEVRTDADNDLSDRIGAETERAEGVEGDLESLETENKDNLVGAINEISVRLDDEATDRGDADENLQNQIGDLENLDTEYKDDLVGAINEICAMVITDYTGA